MNYCTTLLLSLGFIYNTSAQTVPEISLHDKIGQMLIIGFNGKTVNGQSPIVKSIEKDNIGGVILFDYNYQTQTFGKNIESPKQVKTLNHDLQRAVFQANLKLHRPQLPLLISVDYEGGNVARLSEQYGFPKTTSPATIGKGSGEKAIIAAKAMASTLKQTGFNLNFAPMLDVKVNPKNPIIAKKGRSFSSDPGVVTRFAEIYSKQFLRQNIQCVYKHFPGHGSSTTDSHLGFVDVTTTWHSNELIPYQRLIPSKNSCGVIMSAHIVNRQLDDSGLPATLSYKILTGLLRNKLKFKGLIVTDDLQMKAISEQYGLEKSIVLAINAGADILIFGNNLRVKAQDPSKIIAIVEKNIKAGKISISRIEESYYRISKLKSELETNSN
ncbi:MAG: glycoside hydrolase family 3 protein [Legionella sp.]|nr:glycoside hydrolase family 3 protein [Legionella sp.]